MPEDPSNHTMAHKYPFVAFEVLSGNAVIADALLSGGTDDAQPSDNEEEGEDNFFGAEKSRNVRS